MSDEIDELTERRVLAAYQALERPVPTPETDRMILEAAQAACQRQRARRAPWLVWPVSMAAALAVTLGVFYQIARLLPEDPTVIVLAPSEPRAERPAERIGSEDSTRVDDGAVTVDAAALDRAAPPAGTLPAPAVRDRGMTRLRSELAAAARAGDREAFANLLARLPSDATLPALDAQTLAWAREQGFGAHFD